jgi:hypothetical protein
MARHCVGEPEDMSPIGIEFAMFGTEAVDKYRRVVETSISCIPALITYPLMRLISSAAATLLLGICAQAFYLPGAAPHDYLLDEPVKVFVNALTPMMQGKDDAKLVSHCNYELW